MAKRKMNWDEIPEYTDNTERVMAKRQEASSKPPKPLFKMRIGDLQTLEHKPDADAFKFKDYDLSLVACGGRITEISRDDNHFFAFEMDDGSGSISCFHKFKFNREDVLRNISELPTAAHSHMEMSFGDDEPCSANAFVLPAIDFDQETNEAFREIGTWFQDEVVKKTPDKKVGDLIHVMGHLIIGDGIRKINVLDFRIATQKERDDMEEEVEYLNRCVY